MSLSYDSAPASSPLRNHWPEDGHLLLGVVHLAPLPGSPRHDTTLSDRGLSATIEAARRDAGVLLEAGFDGFVVENFGDVPFFASDVPPWVVAALTRIACELPIREAFTVVNVLRNDALAGLAVALAAGLDAIRVNIHCGAMVTDQGIVEGRAAETIRRRAELCPDVSVLADVAVKHALPLGEEFDLIGAARDTAYRGLADALIVTGAATGSAVDRGDLRTVREAVPDRPLIVGSGARADTIEELLSTADGVIVGSGLKPGGRTDQPIDPDLARSFARSAGR